MTKKQDVIICGSSLAGSAAGLALARRGHSVLMLDRAEFPRKKLCGGLLTWKSVKLLAAHFGETPESLTRAGALTCSADGYSIRTLSKTLAEGKLPVPFHFVDRTRFDAHLMERAREAGAETLHGHKVTACDPVNGEVTLDNGQTVQGTYVIGADGANSAVRASFPDVDRARMKQFMAPTIEISIPRTALFRPIRNPELYVGFIDAGYGWVFPNQDKVVIGICGLRQDNFNISQVFKEFIEFLGINMRPFPELHGHPLPYGNYLKAPVHGVTLLAGDAGGLVEPLFGEGIFFALCSGMYAGEAVAQGLETDTDACRYYTARLKHFILPELKASDRLRWILFRSMKAIGPTGLQLFIKAAGRPLTEMVHGIRSYAWLRKKHWDF